MYCLLTFCRGKLIVDIYIYVFQQSELPKPAALQDIDNNIDESDNKKAVNTESNKKDEDVNLEDSDAENISKNEGQQIQVKLPLDIDLNEIASSFMKATEK